MEGEGVAYPLPECVSIIHQGFLDENLETQQIPTSQIKTLSSEEVSKFPSVAQLVGIKYTLLTSKSPIIF